MDQATAKKTVDNTIDESKNDMYKKQQTIATGPEYKGSGIKTSLHGIIYQIKLLTLFLYRGIKHHYKFSLATEVDEAEKFDDLVFSYDDDAKKDRQVYRFVQAKHRQDDSKQIKIDDLMNDSDEDFSVLKYFISYRKIIKKELFKEGEFKDFIICTNIDIHEEVLKPDDITKSTAVYEIDSTKDDIFGLLNYSKSKQYKFTKGSKIYNELKSLLKNFHVNKLATKLAKSVTNKEKTPPKDELFKCYRGWLFDKVFKTERDANGRFLKFGEDFLQDDCNGDETLLYFKNVLLAGIEKAKLKEKVEDVVLKTKFKIPETFTTDAKGSLSLEVADEEIDDFLEKLVLAVNQPNEDELQSIITKEIGRDMNFINGEFIARRLQEYLLDWAKERKGRFLTREDGQKLFECLKQNLARLGLVGVTLAYKSKIEKGFKFQDTVKVIETMRNFLKNKEKQILIIFHKIPLLSAIKMLQANTNTEVDADIFCDSETFQSLFGTSSCPIEALQSEAYNHLAVDDITKSCDAEIILKMTLRLLKRNENKRIILSISHDEKQKFENELKDLLEKLDYDFDKCVTITDNDNNFCNIIPESQQKLLDESKIVFQGKEVSLSSFVGNNNWDLVSTELSNDLVGKITYYEKYEEKASLITKALQSAKIEISDLKSDTFLIAFDSEVTESDLQPNQEIVLISGDADKFKKLCEIQKTKNVHWLTKYFKSVLIKSHKSSGTCAEVLNGYEAENSRIYQETPYVVNVHELQSSRIVIVSTDSIIEVCSGYIDKFINKIKQCNLLGSIETCLDSNLGYANSDMGDKKYITVLPCSQVTESNLQSSEIIVLISFESSDFDKILKIYYSKEIHHLTLTENLVWRQSQGAILKFYHNAVQQKKEHGLFLENLNLLNGHVLSKLISKEKIEIGKSPVDEKYIEAKEYFVERTLQQCLISDNILNSSKDFLIAYDSQIAESEFGLNREIVLISYDWSEFEKLCKMYKSKTIHWLVENVEINYKRFHIFPEYFSFDKSCKFQTESDLQTKRLFVVLSEFTEQENVINMFRQSVKLVLEMEKRKEELKEAVLFEISNTKKENGKEKLIAGLPLSEITESTLVSSEVVLVITKGNDLLRYRKFLKYCETKFIYLLELGRSLTWVKSQGKITNLHRFLNNQIDGKIDLKITDSMVLFKRAAIIAAEPGMGKSTLLNSWAMRIQERLSTRMLWVVKVVLVRYLTEFSEMAIKGIDPLKFLCTIVKPDGLEAYNGVKRAMHEFVHLKSNGQISLRINNDLHFREVDLLEAHMFTRYYNSGNIVIFLDGYDEISPLCKRVVLGLIEKFKPTAIRNRIWVTTRPYNILGELEKTLGTIAYTIKPLSNHNQTEMFFKLLQTKSKTPANEAHIKMFIEKLINKLADDVNAENLSEFIGTPLHVTMMASLYEHESFNYCNSQELDDFITSVVQNFTLLALYEKFINIKLGFIYKGIREEDLTHYYAMDEHRQEILKNHRILALLELFTEEKLQDLISAERIEIVREKMKSLCIKEAKEKTGLIIRVYEERPQFVHRTFAEYFAADLLTSMLNPEDKKYCTDLALTFLYNIWVKEHSKYKVLLNFINHKLISQCDNKSHRDVLAAALNKNWRVLEQIQNLNDIRDAYGRTPLHLAFSSLKYDSMNSLLERSKEELSIQDKLFGWTPLHYAVASLALEEPTRDTYSTFRFGHEVINVQDFKGKTPIMLAVEICHEPTVRYFLAHGPDLNIVDKFGHTAVYYAIDFSYYLLLIAFGANSDDKQELRFFSKSYDSYRVKHDKWVCILLMQIRHGNSNISKYLEIIPNKLKIRFLLEIVVTLDARRMRNEVCTICKIVDVNTTDCEGKTALHYLVNELYQDLVELEQNKAQRALNYQIVRYATKFLLENGADVNQKDSQGKTALHYCAGDCNQSTLLIDGLLSFGADPGIQDNEGRTPLYYALQDDVKVFHLLNGGAYFDDVDTSELSENSILRIVEKLFDSVKENNLINVRSIIDTCKAKNAIVNARSNKSGITLLDISLIEKYGGIIQCLLQYGAYRFSVNHNNSDVEKYLFEAVERGNMSDVEKCIHKGALINCFNYKRVTQPLHLAIAMGHLELTRFLLSKGAYVEGRVASNYTILHTAAESGHTNILIYLLNTLESDKLIELINAEDAYREIPLHKAVRKNDEIAVKELLKKGTLVLNPTQMDNIRAQTLLNIASSNNNFKIAEMLYCKIHSYIKPLDSYENLSEDDRMNVMVDIVNEYYSSQGFLRYIDIHLDCLVNNFAFGVKNK